MGWAVFDSNGTEVFLQMSSTGIVSLSGSGTLRAGGQIADTGEVPQLSVGMRSGWTAVSFNALQARSRNADSAFWSEYSELFPGFEHWLANRIHPCAAVGICEDALNSDHAERDRDAAALLVVLPPEQWNQLATWTQPSLNRRMRVVFKFALYGMPTSALRTSLSDTWQSLGKGFDSVTRQMAEFADNVSTTISEFRV